MLLREQLQARAPGTALVFPTITGRPWRYGNFHKLVWSKAIRRAAEAWREARRLRESAPTPFDDLEPHDLRATAATLMRDAGFVREDAAARLGHADAGALLDRVYDQGDRRARMRKAIESLAPGGLRAVLREPDGRPSAAGSRREGKNRETWVQSGSSTPPRVARNRPGMPVSG